MKRLPILFMIVLILLSCTTSKKPDSIIEIVKEGNITKLKNSITAENINKPDETGATPLMWAAFKGDIDTVKFLVKNGADYNASGIISIDNLMQEYITALDAAVGEGHLDVVRFFVEDCHVNINKRLKKMNDFHLLPEDINEPEKLTKILQTQNNKMNSLIKFNIPDNLDIKKVALITSGYLNEFIRKVDIGILLNKSETKIENPYLLMMENRKILDNLYGNYIKKKECYKVFDCNEALDGTVFITASFRGKKNVIEYLISKKADINIKNSLNINALFAAVITFNYEIADILIANGAEANTIENMFNSSSLQYLYTNPGQEIYKHNKQIKDLTLKLIKNGVNVNHKDSMGETVLYISCSQEFLDLSKFLVENGADPEIKVNGKTIKEFCKEKGIEF